MIVPAIGAIGQAGSSQLSQLASGQLGGAQMQGLTQGFPLAAGEGALGASPAAAAGASEGALPGAAGAGPGNGFSGALSEAISGLERTQRSADGAAQALATGTVSDPESAIVTVQDAQLAMQLASQIRTKAVEAATNIFQTQV